jgi:hypothetical protein
MTGYDGDELDDLAEGAPGHAPDDTTRTPVTICWHCDRPLDAATPVDGEIGAPESGAVSLCMYCGTVAMFGPDLVLRAPTEAEIDALAEDAEFMRTWARFMWARQYVLLRSNLMRDRSDPDR